MAWRFITGLNLDIVLWAYRGGQKMPVNEKGGWINPEDSHKEADEYVGYTVCFCKKGIKLHQAGFDCETHVCAMCKCEVADAETFFKYDDGVRALSK